MVSIYLCIGMSTFQGIFFLCLCFCLKKPSLPMPPILSANTSITVSKYFLGTTPVINKIQIKGVSSNSVTTQSVKCFYFVETFLCGFLPCFQRRSSPRTFTYTFWLYVYSCLIKNYSHIRVSYLMSALKSKIIFLFDNISVLVHPKHSWGFSSTSASSIYSLIWQSM